MESRKDILNKKYTLLRNFLFSFWKSILWGITISVLSLMSGKQVSKVYFLHFSHSDKLVHFVMYFLFSYFLYEGFIKFFKNKIENKHKVTIVFIISALFGIIMEILQITLIETRQAEIFDFVANTTGTIMALLLFRFINNGIRRLFRQPLLF